MNFVRTNLYYMRRSSQQGLQHAFDWFSVACDQAGTKISTVFTIESEQHVMSFSWIGSQNDRVFLFESGYRSAGSDN